MKQIFSGIFVLMFLSIFVKVNAQSYYSEMETKARLVGEYIEKIHKIPLIGKLTNVLPFAVLAACLKECPGQTMILATSLLGYFLLYGQKIRSALYKYNFLAKKRVKVNPAPVFDDSLFIFEDDNENNDQSVVREETSNNNEPSCVKFL